MIRRTQEFTSGNFLVADAFSDNALTKFLRDVVVPIEFPLQKICIPFAPNQVEHITSGDLMYASEDKEVQYVILCKDLLFDSDAREMVSHVLNPVTPHDTAQVAGSFYENIIFVPCTTDNTEVISARFKKVLDCIVTGGDVFKADGLEAVLKARSEKLLEEYILGSIRKRGEDLKVIITNKRDALAEASARVVMLSKDIENAEREMLVLSSQTTGDVKARIASELSELMAYPSLENVQILNGKLMLLTKDMALRESEGRIRPLGRYRVEIEMANCCIKFINLDNKINRKLYEDIAHPHCNPEGEPCLGNLGTILPDLVAANDFLGIWQVVQSFITSYNPHDSWGQRAKFWPKYEADGVTLVVNPEEKCANCGRGSGGRDRDALYEDEWITCPTCDRLVCGECNSRNEDEDAYYCSDCLGEVFCTVCGTHHEFGTEFTSCGHCDERICKNEATFDGDADLYFCDDACLTEYRR